MLDQQILQNADGEAVIGGFGGFSFGTAGQISTSTILTRGLTATSEVAFAVFTRIGMGGLFIKAYWAAGKALGFF